MVRINRTHGFTERIHQLHRNTTTEDHPVREDCIMAGGSCECAFFFQCKHYYYEGIYGEQISEGPDASGEAEG